MKFFQWQENNAQVQLQLLYFLILKKKSLLKIASEKTVTVFHLEFYLHCQRRGPCFFY